MKFSHCLHQELQGKELFVWVHSKENSAKYILQMLVYSVWHVFVCVCVCECVSRRFAVCNLHFKRQICGIHTYTNIYAYTDVYKHIRTHTHTCITSEIRDRGPPSLSVEWGEQWSTCKFTFISAQKPSHTHMHTCINACFTKSYIPLEEQALLCSPGAWRAFSRESPKHDDESSSLRFAAAASVTSHAHTHSLTLSLSLCELTLNLSLHSLSYLCLAQDICCCACAALNIR